MPKYWFRQKRFGYGAQPNTWQGWMFTIASVILVFVVVIGARQIADRRTGMMVALFGVGLIAIASGVITYRKTEGGWRWRSGKDD